MAGIGEASAILGVAQLGLQLAQTLVTVIGDYRDAAVNINHLRDEIHLTSISLHQLGELAKQNSLLPGRGVLEATNLRERCRSVIWEIRTVIKKGDDPLHPEEISRAEIDVSYFTAWKWALWTKKHLDGPRLELDRLKDSLTLTFVTHMAILGSQQERERYKQQIPGIKRNVDWAEERYRGGVEDEPVPADVLNAGPAEWQQFLDWKAARQSTDMDSVSHVSRGEPIGMTGTNTPPATPSVPERPANVASKYECWSLDPMAERIRLPIVSHTAQNRDQLLRAWTRLNPWYARQVDDLVKELNSEGTHEWFVVTLKVVHRPLFLRLERPPKLQIFLRGDLRPVVVAKETRRIEIPQLKTGAPEVEAVPYSEIIPIDMPADDEDKDRKLSDEEIIEKQLTLYKQQ